MRRLLIAAAVLVAGSAAHADTLQTIKNTGVIKLGYHADAEPFSFTNPQGTPVGYSMDLCRQIAAAVQQELGLSDLKIELVKVDYKNRFDAVESGKVDIECGSATITLSRMERVDFSLMTFVTGGAVVSRADSPLQSVNDIAGKKVAVIKATTAEAALNAYVDRSEIKAEIVTVEDGTEGIRRLSDGDVDGFANDQVTLIGQIVKTRQPEKFALSRDLYSFEPYGLMMRRNDANFRLVANRALARLYRTGQFQPLYGKWFARVGIEPSPVLIAMYSLQAIPE
ncbi:MAG: amino acid ABC transporter substrate-binding protein [Gammaproteobacteria bacterium]|nr:amino acid ABC transporter substrate-binding protein [Gammaproteobacteria bacterium]MBT8444367.1 amino acid ABC transporter substrate-binding protein [Gammaproteobacteria bacterium]NND35935.1 amino acid ABC transporter substrate-binding protein [Gammaproteobacteria bacterium]